MKPSSFVSLPALLLAAAVASVQFLPIPGAAATLRVPQDYPSVTAAAVVAQSGDVIEAFAAHDYVNDNATIRSGVTVRGIPREQAPPIPQPTFSSSTFTLLDGPDSTRIENLLFVHQNFENQIVAFTPRVVVTGCTFYAPSPLWFASLELWSGGAVRFSEFHAINTESTGFKLREGTLDVSYCVFSTATFAVAIINQNQGFADATIKNNTLSETNVRFELQEGSQVDVVNNIFDHSETICVGNATADVRYNDFYEGFSDCGLGVGNINANPLYCNSQPFNFWLDASSPCVGTGEAGANMGAQEVRCGVTGIPDAAESPKADIRLVISPNPVRARTEFRISGAAEPTALEIFDAAGRVVDIIQPGRAPYVWEPSSSVRPGVYFVRLRAQEGSATSKFVVLPR